MHSSDRLDAPRDRSLAPRLLFAAILLACAVWVLTLPMFPSQDGPMHRYYIHVLDSLLQHQTTYNVYEIRHPFPPYLTHYGILLLLFHVFSYDLAEKLFTCLVLACFAYGLRAAAKEVGPSGAWVTLLVAPLLFSWPLMMGFFNFVLGLGLLLFCAAYWQKMKRTGVRALLPFTLLLIALTFTHPIPLLLLILLSGIDLVLSLLVTDRPEPLVARARAQWPRFAALGFMLVAAMLPLLAIDTSRTGKTVSEFFFHPEFLRTSLLLNGLSPYNTRATSFWINGCRLALYATFAVAMWMGARACIAALRQRRVNYGTTLFIATVLLTLALPFLPNLVNGSDYFASRLVFVLWPGALLAASAAPLPSPRNQQRWLLAGAVCCVAALVPAQIFLRPIAVQLRKAELQPIPHGVPGSLLMGRTGDEYLRFHDQLNFDPFKWGAVLAFIHANDVVLDSPWIDQRITPIEAVPGGPELVTDIAYSRTRKPGDPDAPATHERSLPARQEARIVHDSDFLLFSGKPAELAYGLSQQLDPSEAAKYRCGPPQGWYMLCVSRDLPQTPERPVLP